MFLGRHLASYSFYLTKHTIEAVITSWSLMFSSITDCPSPPWLILPELKLESLLDCKFLAAKSISLCCIFNLSLVFVIESGCSFSELSVDMFVFTIAWWFDYRGCIYLFARLLQSTQIAIKLLYTFNWMISCKLWFNSSLCACMYYYYYYINI